MKAAAAFAIINFIWQGAAIGALAAAGFALARTPRVRYLIGVAALALMAAAPVITSAVSLKRAVVPDSPRIEVPAARPGGEATARGTLSFGESGTASPRVAWRSVVEDPRVTSTVLIVWLVGVALLSARLAFGWLGVRRLTRRVTVAAANVQAVASRLVAALNIRATVRVVESALVKVPAVIGAFKPVVLLPAAAMSGLSMEQVEALLAHELAHVRRYDYLVNLLQSAIETLLFYHPAVWLVSRRVRQERELCCDDLALEVCGDRVAYASALADLESLRALPSPALAATGGSLLARVRRILGHEEVSALAGRSQSLAGIAILASIILLAGGQVARVKAEDARRTERSPTAPLASEDSRRAEWSSTPPQESQTSKPTQGVVGGVQGGVVAGASTGIPAGISGGVPDGVVGGVPGNRVVTPDPQVTLNAQNDETQLAIGNELQIWVYSPIVQPEFSQRSYKIDTNGVIALPHIDRVVKLAGLKVGEARTLIRNTLIDQKQYNNPRVDISIVRGSADPAVQNSPTGPPIAIGQVVRLEVSVGLVRQSEFNKDYTVQPDGTIVVPYIGAIKAAGPDVYSLQTAIEAALNAKNTLPGAKVSASIEARQTPPPPPPAPKATSVTVQGAVRAPGSMMLREERAKLTDVLANAGGFTPSAGQRVWLRRSGVADNVYLKQDLIEGKIGDVKLQDGDVITVEVAPHFYVTGYVKNSSSEYNWEPGMTLGKAIAMAGGVSNEGALARVSVRRKDPKTNEPAVKIDKFLNVKLDKDPMMTPIEPDDVIAVPKKRM